MCLRAACNQPSPRVSSREGMVCAALPRKAEAPTAPPGLSPRPGAGGSDPRPHQTTARSRWASFTPWFPNHQRKSVPGSSISCCFSVQTRQVTAPLRSEIPSSCPRGQHMPQKAGGFPAGAAGISPEQRGRLKRPRGRSERQSGRLERQWGSGSVHISPLPLRVSRVPRQVPHHHTRRAPPLTPQGCPPPGPAGLPLLAARQLLQTQRSDVEQEKANPVLVTPWAFPASAKEQH